jgi:hypothetical protein
MQDRKNESKRTNTDAILKNLTSTDDAIRDGNFIKDVGNGSFSNINTEGNGWNGEVADVDDL